MARSDDGSSQSDGEHEKQNQFGEEHRGNRSKLVIGDELEESSLKNLMG